MTRGDEWTKGCEKYCHRFNLLTFIPLYTFCNFFFHLFFFHFLLFSAKICAKMISHSHLETKLKSSLDANGVILKIIAEATICKFAEEGRGGGR